MQASESPTVVEHGASVERPSDRELVVTRAINGSAQAVFEAWTRPELFERWWTPKSFPIFLVSCEIDAHVGGSYRLVFGLKSSTETFAYFGRYLEVTPNSRLVWTNDEGDEDGVVTTATFEEDGGTTRIVVHDRYPSKEALEAAVASGSTEGLPESLAQLDELLSTRAGGG
jgi:uncharacterized protein YndB with AHSA1/START domain